MMQEGKVVQPAYYVFNPLGSIQSLLYRTDSHENVLELNLQVS